jgi:protein-tyrosine-phosphatase
MREWLLAENTESTKTETVSRALCAMILHFICTGNTYRSRMAEAYGASRRVPGLSVLSSGIQAGLSGLVPISQYAAETLRGYGLEGFASASWQQTTAALVRKSDVLVFMEDEHYRFCRDWVDPSMQMVQIWDIPDIGPGLGPVEIRTKAERTFAMIQHKTDLLLARFA